MPKVVIYLRVSTNEQTTENQLPALEKWVADRGYKLVEVYSENESAWKSGHQRELARLFSDLRAHKADICLVWALDRLTREGIAKMFELLNRFRAYGVRVISLQDSWTEFASEFTPLFQALVAWMAEFESKRKSERIKAGNERRRQRGLPVGRPKGAKDKEPRKRTGYLLRFANPKMREKYG